MEPRFRSDSSRAAKGILGDVTAVTTETTIDRFRRAGALLEGHFRLTSGLHSAGYLQSALVLQHPADAAALGEAIAALVRPLGPQVVLSPALGGIVIGQEVGRALGLRAIFAERQDGALTLRRGFTLGPGEKVLVVEDVITTGGSTLKAVEKLRAAGYVVAGVVALVDRLEGGRENIEAEGVAIDALYTRRDFIPES